MIATSQNEPSPEPQAQTLDGRSARRERGKVAVINAAAELILEGNLQPVADDIARRAGVSVASLFRYFDNLDDLRLATEQQALHQFVTRLAIDDIGQGSLEERVTNFAASRARYYEESLPMALYMRTELPRRPEIAANREKVIGQKRQQLAEQFAPELKRCTPAARDDLMAALSVLTSFDAWHQFRFGLNRSQVQIRRIWKRSILALLNTS